VATGEAFVLDNEGFRIPQRSVSHDAVDDELRRFHASVAAVSRELESCRQAVTRQLGEQYGAIFSAQLQMLRDARLQEQVESLVRTEHFSPEYSVSRVLGGYAKVFQNLENRYMAERAHDVVDIEKRLLRDLLGRQREELTHLTSPVIILTHDLTPSEAANLDPKNVLAFVSEAGGPGGHTAIVAEALEIPAVVGTGPFLSEVSGGDLLIVDGDQGLVILQPDEETLARYQREAEQHRSQARLLEQLRDLPAETQDGYRIQLNANIEFPREVTSCVARGAEGIGLYRTEFLYLGRAEDPTEADHFEAYAQVVQAMQGRPVVIRTLDLGADKMGRDALAEDERNPFLGLRSIRLSLRNVPVFRTQLRAILRASALGPVHVMFPLISTLPELREAKKILQDLMEELERAGEAFDRKIPVGMMVEVPAAAMLADRFAREVDFLSLGTNDLIQYTLAVDRSNKDVATLYNASDPAVVQLIGRVVQAACSADIPVALCGQMSANPVYTMLLLGLGLTELSVPPLAVPEIKHVCRSVTLSDCRRVAETTLNLESALEITEYLKRELALVLPDLPVH
jgi:phosphotransferase system enzyme I (PtsI)